MRIVDISNMTPLDVYIVCRALEPNFEYALERCNGKTYLIMRRRR